MYTTSRTATDAVTSLGDVRSSGAAGKASEPVKGAFADTLHGEMKSGHDTAHSTKKAVDGDDTKGSAVQQTASEPEKQDENVAEPKQGGDVPADTQDNRDSRDADAKADKEHTAAGDCENETVSTDAAAAEVTAVTANARNSGKSLPAGEHSGKPDTEEGAKTQSASDAQVAIADTGDTGPTTASAHVADPDAGGKAHQVRDVPESDNKDTATAVPQAAVAAGPGEVSKVAKPSSGGDDSTTAANGAKPLPQGVSSGETPSRAERNGDTANTIAKGMVAGDSSGGDGADSGEQGSGEAGAETGKHKALNAFLKQFRESGGDSAGALRRDGGGAVDFRSAADAAKNAATGTAGTSLPTGATTGISAPQPSAPNAPLSMNVSVPVKQQGWDQALGERMVWMAKGGIKEARLQLNPRDMGPIDVKIHVHHDQASVNFTAQHAHTREALESAMPRLREMMAESGLNLAQADVQQRSAAEQGGRGNGQGSGGRASAGMGDDEAMEGLEEAHLSHVGAGDGAVDYFA